MESPHFAAGLLQGRRILIVEDTQSEQLLLANFLEQQGCRVYLAHDGQDAFRKVQLINPDLVLMDVMMPICDGLTCCRMMQSVPQLRGIPVVFLTGAGMPDQRVQGLMVGAVDYIVKPFRLEEVKLRLLIHLREDAGRRLGASESFSSVSNLDSLIFQAARHILVSSLSSTPELHALAAKVGTNSKRLNEAFRCCTGGTVFEYLREERMKESCRLLRHTALLSQDIALEVGFTSGASFSTAFRERYGLTPKQFRRAQGGIR